MATSTLTPTRPSPALSSIGWKIVMAISGLYLVFFVLFHMYGNLKLFAGQHAFDDYAHHLRTMFEPILPHEGFLWLFRLSLILAVGLHIYAASTLWKRANAARGTKYSAKMTVQRSLSSKAMRWGGITLFVFIIWHLAHFTVIKFTGDGRMGSDFLVNGVESPYKLVVASFQIWWVTLIYLVALCALAMHLHHGTWSAIQTLGWTNSVKARTNAKLAAVFVAVAVAGGFALTPVAILVGIIK
ncbi:succinate dehydrogenase subunit C [Austwickia chelonae]|uniref:Succinate dehydrogenase cytochrome b subunit n=1 Tax=Austwickia chelonae NBRC 105200 TaxID=1184607 RepID=K6VMS2_9MICO|nr:succinate dehydrogenase cytochrome b subunit [Austwickia chelonae]GAB77989.1 succinate dehydrogenase cytochrome b subunit [Austwickia chelonae NBRC 105200]SEV93774.1 succinate dehydrogenase subunit C [Austwickia chelonae]